MEHLDATIIELRSAYDSYLEAREKYSDFKILNHALLRLQLAYKNHLKHVKESFGIIQGGLNEE